MTTQLLPVGHPLAAALFRSLPAGLLAVLWARRLPQGLWWWRVVVLGALNIGVLDQVSGQGLFRVLDRDRVGRRVLR